LPYPIIQFFPLCPANIQNTIDLIPRIFAFRYRRTSAANGVTAIGGTLSHIKDSIKHKEKVKNVLLILEMIVIFNYLD